jgi:hypothetical protein
MYGPTAAWLVFAAILTSCVASPAAHAFTRTEARQPCGGRDPSSYQPEERRPFFGDLHVHTAYSIDAFVFNVRSGPRDAYDFARGLPLLGADGVT